MALPALDDRTADVLSSREREVLVLLAEGRTNREIAAELSVTLATVKSHLVRVYAKLEATNRNEAVGAAWPSVSWPDRPSARFLPARCRVYNVTGATPGSFISRALPADETPVAAGGLPGRSG